MLSKNGTLMCDNCGKDSGLFPTFSGMFPGFICSNCDKILSERNEILDTLRDFKLKELKAISKYCHNYHYAYRQPGLKHIITEITIELYNKDLNENEPNIEAGRADARCVCNFCGDVHPYKSSGEHGCGHTPAP